jgi:6-phosphogluconolactonase
MAEVELRVTANAEEAARLAAGELVRAAAEGGHIAVSGGSSPKRAYELASLRAPDWSRVGLWWADERCVPPDDERSNFRLARAALLDRLLKPPRAVHRVLGELDPHEAARRYDEELRGVTLDLALLGIGADGHTASLFPHHEALEEEERLAVAVERPDVGRVTLDLALLGIGADGHTASLFPHHEALEEEERLAVAVERPDVARVTLTPPPLRAALHIVFLVLGEEKADAVRRAFGTAPDPGTPASLIRGVRTTAILDREAAAELSR